MCGWVKDEQRREREVAEEHEEGKVIARPTHSLLPCSRLLVSMSVAASSSAFSFFALSSALDMMLADPVPRVRGVSH